MKRFLEGIEERMDFLVEYGFSIKETKKIYKGVDDFFIYPIDTMKALLCLLENYGFSKKQIKNIILRAPKILGHSDGNIIAKLRTIERVMIIRGKNVASGKDDVIVLCCTFPKILSFKPGKNETLDKKIRLHLLIWEDMKEMTKMAVNMIQGNRKTIDRINEMKRKKIEWRKNRNIFR